jgi:hypothetical protein
MIFRESLFPFRLAAECGGADLYGLSLPAKPARRRSEIRPVAEAAEGTAAEVPGILSRTLHTDEFITGPQYGPMKEA